MKLNLLSLGLAFPIIGLFFTGCSSWQSVSTPPESGFLGDYSLLEPGDTEQANHRYVQSGADFSQYDALLIDPVTIWYAEDGVIESIPREDIEQLSGYFHAVTAQRLEKVLPLTDKPGPNVLRLRLALTEVAGAERSIGLARISGGKEETVPRSKALSRSFIVFVGKARAEAEVLDASTGERLAAAVDETVGTRSEADHAGTWDDVYQALDTWSEGMGNRMEALVRNDHLPETEDLSLAGH